MYRALYRKWRPQVFSDVSGQSHITETLMHEVEANRLSHAYLFTGSRGTGKTTCAKILSKAVNCLNPVNGNPCNECEVCRGIDDGSVLDVTEIDAASNNGVDNIRDLREEANFTPAVAKYRVYIIDEVHMLSTGAFNALLKTLEEPPAHVLFILATTEVHMLPATILSRCQRFDFRRIPPEDISKRLMLVAENENLSLADDASMLIARISDGALRDALSILDQCASYNEPITVTTVSKAAGLLGKEYLFEISEAIKNQDNSTVLNIIDRLHASSCDMERLVSELVNHFRNVMITKTTKNPEEFVVCTPDELNRYKDYAASLTYGTILYIMETLCAESAQLKYSAHQRAKVETMLIRLCSPKLSTDNSALIARIDELQAQIMSLKANGVQTSIVQNTTASAVATVASEPETVNSTPANSPAPEVVPEKTVSPQKINEQVFEEPPLPDEYGNYEQASTPANAPSSESPLQSTPPLQSATPEQPKPVDIPEATPSRGFENSAPRATIDMSLVTEADKSMPFTAWENVLEQLSKINKPLYPVLAGSQAFRAGNTIFIKAKNMAFPALFKVKMNYDAISESIIRATGEKLRPAIYTDGESPVANEGVEPVDVLIAKLNKMQIDFIVEE
ncbi:MAG: DNA polymerase III subunit gamma/tau [Clostridia bacterium]|nr:DNA polymerase III subunit gamma/tau [Clostridia bacterium]